MHCIRTIKTAHNWLVTCWHIFKMSPRPFDQTMVFYQSRLFEFFNYQKQTTKFSSANFKKMLSPSVIILRIQRLEEKQCRPRWDASSRSTLFANSAIFVSGTERVKNWIAMSVLRPLRVFIYFIIIHFLKIIYQRKCPINIYKTIFRYILIISSTNIGNIVINKRR